MNQFKIQQLLQKVAKNYANTQQRYSKEEIIGKINEIKYLAAQKKVPKLTLRKEIIHLEDKLQGIFEVEKKILETEKRESAKIRTLKGQITTLRNRIAKSEDKDLQKRVNKLSHLLGECLATHKIAQDVALSKKVAEELNVKPVAEKKPLAIAKVHALEHRLETLKHMITEKGSQDPERAAKLNEKIVLIQKKLQSHGPKQERVKHTMMFHTPPPQKKEIGS